MNQPLSERPKGRGIYLLPNLFTLSALFAGFYALVMATEQHFNRACVAIFIAMILDALDGRIARLTNTQTLFGAELDSLSDMVCFGIAPALVMYCWTLHALGKAGWLIAFVYAATVAIRLARFNVAASHDKHHFIGLPCPAGAAVLAGLVWNGYSYQIHSPTLIVIIGLLTLLVSFAMVSRFRYRSFKDLNLRGKFPFATIFILVLILVLIAINPPEVIFLVFLAYLVSAPVLWLYRRRALLRLRRQRHNR